MQYCMHIVDQERKPYTGEVETVTCDITYESAGNKIDCSVKKIDINRYTIRYRPINRGMHQLHIKVEGEHIKGSPFKVFVQEGYTSEAFSSSCVSTKIRSNTIILLYIPTIVYILLCTAIPTIQFKLIQLCFILTTILFCYP